MELVRAVTVIALLCLLALKLEASASSESANQSSGNSAAAASLAAVPVKAYQPHYLVGNNLSEIWDYRLWFPNGYLLNCRFMITSIGPGERTGLVLAYILPPEGDTVVMKNSRKWGDWKDLTEGKGPQFVIAKNRLSVDLPNHHLHVENAKGTIDLEMQSTVAPLQPGRILFSKQEWYDATLFAPRLEASGELRLPGQAPIPLKSGRGIATHIVSNVPDNSQSVSLFRFDSFDATTEVSLYQLTMQEANKFKRVGFLTTIHNNQIAVHSTTFDRRFSDLKPDPNFKGYLVPKKVSIDYDSKLERIQGNATLQFHLKRPQEILNLLNSKILRFVLKKVAANPVLYQNRSDYRFEIRQMEDRSGTPSNTREDTEVIAGEGFASLYLTKKPPNDF